LSVLKAWDPVKRQLVWERPLDTFWNGGVLATAGGLVIQGVATGRLNVFDANSGKLLASIDVGTGIMAAPMTYRLGSVQYISVMAGYGGGPGLYAPFPKETAAYKYDNEGRIITLRLGGPAVPKPAWVKDAAFDKPPPREGSDSQINSGAILYNRFCSRCHVFGRAELPDLRKAVAMPPEVFAQIVRGGSLAANGMGDFADVISPQDLTDIRRYLIDQAWDAYTHQAVH
jgi:quinohemoprotein ethanol dehydrogenase